jgi:hypothetical protein
MDKSNKIENLANKYVERHIRDRHLSDISSILYEPVEISNTDKKILEIGIALGLKSAISCIFGSLLKDDCNIKDEIIDISKHIKEKLISDNHG